MNGQRSDILNGILSRGIVAVVRLPEPEHVVRVVDALVAGGVTCIEITMTVPGAVRIIESIVPRLAREVILGAGTVIGRDQARTVLEAGAQFLVSPVTDLSVVEVAHHFGRPVMPGAYTPTEIQRAWEAGADVVKVFPADQLGMSYFRAVLAPMPHVRLMPTGGVTLANAGDWLMAGACAVGVGSALVDREAIARGDFGRLTESARTICRSVAAARSGDRPSADHASAGP